MCAYRNLLSLVANDCRFVGVVFCVQESGASQRVQNFFGILGLPTTNGRLAGQLQNSSDV